MKIVLNNWSSLIFSLSSSYKWFVLGGTGGRATSMHLRNTRWLMDMGVLKLKLGFKVINYGILTLTQNLTQKYLEAFCGDKECIVVGPWRLICGPTYLAPTTKFQPKIQHLACLNLDTSLSHFQHIHFFLPSVV